MISGFELVLAIIYRWALRIGWSVFIPHWRQHFEGVVCLKIKGCDIFYTYILIATSILYLAVHIRIMITMNNVSYGSSAAMSVM